MQFAWAGIIVLGLALTTTFAADSNQAAVNPQQELFEALIAVQKPFCRGKDDCTVSLRHVVCTWQKDREDSDTCRFQPPRGGKERTISGAKAKRLGKAIRGVTTVETTCAAGTCGFEEAFHTECLKKRVPFTADGGRNGIIYTCSANTAQKPACFPASEKRELAALQAKLKAAKEQKPDCVNNWGGSTCLSTKEQVRMERLRAKESSCLRKAQAGAEMDAEENSPQQGGLRGN
jgi:hypothetical protein